MNKTDKTEVFPPIAAICKVILLCACLVTASCGTIGMNKPIPMVDFGPGFDTDTLNPTDTAVAVVETNGTHVLCISSGHSEQWPSVTFTPRNGKWNLDGCGQVMVDVVNTGSRILPLGLRVDNPGGNSKSNSVQRIERIDPGEARTLAVDLGSMGCMIDPPMKMVGVRARPGVGLPDRSNVTRVIVFVNEPKTNHTFTIANIRAGGTLQHFTPETFIPFIDTFGQYRHREWPGKIHSVADFAARREAEELDLAAHPCPAHRNSYGGWTDGPQLATTGFFRVEKSGAKWWLVDPEGRLFWSYGVNCVGAGDATPITDREDYFDGLSASNSVLQQFKGLGYWAPIGYYTNQIPYATVNYFTANLQRKDGTNWMTVMVDRTHQRLRSWGVNTIGNWSWGQFHKPQQTPYVGTFATRSVDLAGSDGYWHKFPDVFAPAFTNDLHKSISKSGCAGDPWCIGFFVDNEMSWGDELSLAFATLHSPADQAAKRALADDLQARYVTIAALNTAWGTSHASWEEWMASTATQNLSAATADLRNFQTRTVETYFRSIKQVLAEVAPGQIYLGCRFADTNKLAIITAAKYCDVVSFNWYKPDVDALALPDGIDRPIIIGEFHFGASDRGLFSPGISEARDQVQVAEYFTRYMRGALHDPQIVGAHWFEYRDEPATGRGDGENLPCGFVDICDTPQPLLINASRQLAETMYELRAAGK